MAPAAESPQSAPSATAGALRQLQTDVGTINQLGIPIGWDDNPPRPDTWWWINKVLGLILTGLAASLVAPFWFDILKKITTLRTAGRAPASTDKQ